MRVVYFDTRRPPGEVERDLRAECRTFDDLLAEADFISVHVALTPQTRHLFGTDQFRAMKDTAVIVNSSRGPVIDEAALVEALRAGEIFGAGPNLFEREPAPTLIDPQARWSALDIHMRMYAYAFSSAPAPAVGGHHDTTARGAHTAMDWR
ncbi:MAG: NAD(P)-dependent oxidoreductase [Streptosporangiaceae bacterium]